MMNVAFIMRKTVMFLQKNGGIISLAVFLIINQWLSAMVTFINVSLGTDVQRDYSGTLLQGTSL